MITPHVLWSVALVVLACGLNRGRVTGAVEAVTRQYRQYLALSVSLGMLLCVFVLLAEAVAAGLRVTAPTVRLAAGAAVGVNAVAAVLSRRRTEAVAEEAAAGPTQGSALRLAWWSLTGLARVEVVAAVWSVTLDHGRAVGVAAVLIGTATSLVIARGGDRADGAIVRRTLATPALCVAVLVGVNGVLGL